MQPNYSDFIFWNKIEIEALHGVHFKSAYVILRGLGHFLHQLFFSLQSKLTSCSFYQIRKSILRVLHFFEGKQFSSKVFCSTRLTLSFFINFDRRHHVWTAFISLKCWIRPRKRVSIHKLQPNSSSPLPHKNR